MDVEDLHPREYAHFIRMLRMIAGGHVPTESHSFAPDEKQTSNLLARSLLAGYVGCLGGNRAVDARPRGKAQVTRSVQIAGLYLKSWLLGERWYIFSVASRNKFVYYGVSM